MLVETLEHNGKAIEIHTDDDSESPRDWDNLGTLVCFHRQYNLGDSDHGYDSKDFDGWEALYKQIMKDHRPAAIVPLFLMDHSGITISHNAESFRACDPDGWDWGSIGFAFVSREKALSEYDCKRLSPNVKAKALKALLGEIETYDEFLRGNVYGYTINDDEESCWGIYGLDNCIEDAKVAAEIS